MSITITVTVTDPTKEECVRMANYFVELAGVDSATTPPAVDTVQVPPPPPAPPESVELDAAQMPWDPEKHASSRAKTSAGLWKAKRGSKSDVPPADTAQVPPPPPADTAQVPPPPPADTVQVPPPPADTLTFGKFVDMIMHAKNAGQLTIEGINGVIASVGLPSLPALAGKPELIPLVKERLGL